MPGADGQGSSLDFSRLATQGAALASRLRGVPFDARSMNSPSFHPQQDLLALGTRVWRERWLWALRECVSDDHTLTREAVDFVAWGLSEVNMPLPPVLEAARYAIWPDQLDWHSLARSYEAHRRTTRQLHVVWPLQADGHVLVGEPTVLADVVTFVPGEISAAAVRPSSGHWDPRAAFQELATLLPDLVSRPPVAQEMACAAWLHSRIDDLSGGLSGQSLGPRWSRGQMRVYLALSALRLAAPGALGATCGLLLPTPLFGSQTTVLAVAETPHGLAPGESILRYAWPEAVPLTDALSIASALLRDMLDVPWLATESLVQSHVRVQPAGAVVHVHNPLPYTPSSYLDFALYLLDLSHGRTQVEATLFLWAAMEALFLGPKDRTDWKVVARRAIPLIDPNGDVGSRAALLGRFDNFRLARHSLAHGKDKAQRGRLPHEVADYRDLVRQCTAAMVRLAANWTRAGKDASDHEAVMHELDSDAKVLGFKP